MSGSAGFFALRHLGIWAFYVCVGLLGVSMGMQKSSSQSLLADLVDKHELGEYSPIVGIWLAQVFTKNVLCCFPCCAENRLLVGSNQRDDAS